VSQPAAELASRCAKHVRNCEEVYLGKRGITHVGNFEGFVNLVTVYLCDNQLQRLENLQCCKRLKHLYAHNNVLTSIDPLCLRKMTFLETLSLRGNRLRDLRAKLQQLSHLLFLQDLTLDGKYVVQL
jgi:Leucine-rich repeat (LRR) protein